MKQYIPLILLIILITSCAPIVEVEEAQPVESQKSEISEGLETKSQSETPAEEAEEIIEETQVEETALEEPEEIAIEENIIEIGASFSPAEKTIQKGTEIKWVKKDTRNYKIACYLKGARVIQSPDLKQGDSFTYTFLKEGKYTCITYPYGLRNIITVKAQAPLLSPTGSAVRLDKDANLKTAPIAAIAIISIISLLFFIYKRKK